MKVVRSEEGQPRQGTTFRGEATLTTMLAAQQENGMSLTLVDFKDGAVTNWHEHPGEQILYILEGKGRVGNQDTEWEVGPGDIVYTGPGENHWHGAAAGHSMRHISITTVGSPLWHPHAPNL